MDNKEKALTVGVGIAAATLGAYLLWGPGGQKRRRVVKGWMVKMKGEIIEQLENLEKVTEPVYRQVVDRVSTEYAKLKNVDKAELSAVVADLHQHWRELTKKAKPKPQAPKKKTKPRRAKTASSA